MVAEVEELNNVVAGKRAAGLALVLEDGEARNGEANEGIELGGLEVSPKQSSKLLSHASSALFSVFFSFFFICFV